VRSALSLVAAAVALTAFQRPAFRQGVELIRVPATVRSDEGRLIGGLKMEHFEVRVDGKPVAIEAFSAEPRPLTLVLMLDVSGSMIDRIIWSRDAGLALVDALAPDDRLRIGSFGAEINLSPSLTSDTTKLRNVLMTELWPGGSTPLWDAVYKSFRSLDGESGRRAVLAISDGGGSPTAHELELTPTITPDAVASGVIIYAIGTKAKGLGEFRNLARQSGGGHIALSDIADIRQIMREVVQELRYEYLLGFAPPVLDGRVHDLSVRVNIKDATAVTSRRFRAPSGKQ
jgi:VWFA-related protein